MQGIAFWGCAFSAELLAVPQWALVLQFMFDEGTATLRQRGPQKQQSPILWTGLSAWHLWLLDLGSNQGPTD